MTPSFDGGTGVWTMDIVGKTALVAERSLGDEGRTMVWVMRAPKGAVWTRTFEKVAGASGEGKSEGKGE